MQIKGGGDGGGGGGKFEVVVINVLSNVAHTMQSELLMVTDGSQ